ncbi:hypothetical protein ACFFUT_12510 [Pseudohalocynthiibacter aestuariivivens]|uniref:Uncharacterized protein n=1 Tax=Pseudohalocynthiibacter aestuariivivens TaxID=1591409 RepID=A0ABV5JGN3_9RHOB|nr:hypothetical protein [Pseudohalocynthiibacter aestuariivivens]MBS9718955.1 hypothetical protein [Pseudohalocynthiibacter aestuariivivens]
MKKLSLLVAIGALIIVLGVFFEEPEVAKETPPANAAVQDITTGFEIFVEASPASAFTAELTVNTNIPLPIEVMASLSIKDQNPTDTYIGVSKRVTITSPVQTVILDGESENLPAGEYLAEVTFYPRWGAENGPSAAREIREEILGIAEIELTGSGESKGQADQRNVAQKWVIENVVVGTQWNESQFVKVLGEYAKSEADLNLHDAYYFPQADMTIIVRRSNCTVAIWRMGKATR